MLEKEEKFNRKTVEQVAEKMCLAARTAPKGCGRDFLEIAVVKDVAIAELAKKTVEIGNREENKTFLRDGENVKAAAAIVLIGTKKQTLGLKYCGLCGFSNCAGCEAKKGVCAFNTGDLGIAIGSAVSVAMDNRVDNRIMYTIGKAAVEAKFLGKDVAIAYGIPLSATSKNPFFDRK